MAAELLFNPGPQGEHLPGFPRSHADGPTLERAARIRGVTKDAYVAEALSLRYSDGKPMFRVATRASEDVRAVAAEVKEQAAPAEDAPKRKG